jgi:SAM-dependent methyltransferase
MANEDQATFWTETAGPIWLSREKELDVASRKFGEAALDAAKVSAGERVVDVGCGTGSTTIELARRVGPDGRVLGLDISDLLLDRARDNARAADVANAEFLEGDAQTHEFSGGAYDLVYSRFGIMFFEDPVAAFANMRRALTSDGRLAFVCWQALMSNAWMSVPVMAASSVLGAFDPPSTDSPGPFFFADPERVRNVLGSAGYADIDVRPFETTMDTESSEVSEWLGFILRMGPLGGAFLDAQDEDRERTMAAVLEAVAPHESNGTYRLPASTWVVTARR